LHGREGERESEGGGQNEGGREKVRQGIARSNNSENDDSVMKASQICTVGQPILGP
jgi:hypothetical protein